MPWEAIETAIGQFVDFFISGYHTSAEDNQIKTVGRNEAPLMKLPWISRR
jgi:hypothetical protein